MATKICSKCKKEKMLSEFAPRKDSVDGLKGACKECFRTTNKAYADKNKEKLRKKAKEWKDKNLEHVKKYRKEYNATRDDSEYKRQWYLQRRTSSRPFKIKLNGMPRFIIDAAGQLTLVQHKDKPQKTRKRDYDIFLRANFKDKIRLEKKAYMSKRETKERVNANKRLRRKVDFTFKFTEAVSNAVRRAITLCKGTKGGKTWEHLPYTPEELIEHIESLWEEWMNWSNYGPASSEVRTWQIDHIIPQANLPYTSLNDENFQKCWALENLRPLDAARNISKGSRIEFKI